MTYLQQTESLQSMNVTVIGCGTIGAGWAATFAAAGHRVKVYDLNPASGERLANVWLQALPVLQRIGVCVDDPQAPSWTDDLNEALLNTQFIQEALPERLPLKLEILTQIEEKIADDVLIASSSSGLSPSQMQANMRMPQRLLIGHPCNPPYLMPLVEICGGEQTAPQALDKADAIYQSLGKSVLRLQKEASGHLVNRLQAALWREAVHLAAEGYASVGDIEKAVTQGLGARWSILGPTAIFHLAGADQGLAKFLDDLGTEVEKWWSDLGTPELSDEVKQVLINGMDAAAGEETSSAMAARRDEQVVAMIEKQQSLQRKQKGSDA
ncbi:carnitine 3-dehydrogenase [Paenochrobactrum gallinarii]|uniref:Carnitine 3-dehydrogenase n=1 Tax=Paenochrobactrum gallinarii TaxID=643673 RepID=A0A841LXJ2_9HYPH|nr:3-hydroxyacyl-CoA dehydrogenase NAD-binding domain-containing protein [Paenochrobactrum gallinarii]MBB6260369.1 carnitine 3-dehydrogenase [Paenochrobactrum gallinarii]